MRWPVPHPDARRLMTTRQNTLWNLNNLEFHLLGTGHFALEEDLNIIAATIRDFLERNLSR